MGKPVRIVDLAKTLTRVLGKRESDVKIVFTGMRPGEKLHEDLFYESETMLSTPLVKVMRAQGNLPPWRVLSQALQELRALAPRESADQIRRMVKQIIPEYEWAPVLQPELVVAALQIQPIEVEEDSGSQAAFVPVPALVGKSYAALPQRSKFA
jgi:hypothetical protein